FLKNRSEETHIMCQIRQGIRRIFSYLYCHGKNFYRTFWHFFLKFLLSFACIAINEKLAGHEDLARSADPDQESQCGRLLRKYAGYEILKKQYYRLVFGQVVFGQVLPQIQWDRHSEN